MDKQNKFDVIVIGGGPGGYNCAIRCSQLGLQVALIEKDELGGVCLNQGCIPSKSLLSSSKYYHFCHKEIKNHGIFFDKISYDVVKIQERKNNIVDNLRKGLKFLIKKNKIHFFQGTASFQDSNIIKICNKDKKFLISANNIVIASGSIPKILSKFPQSEYFIYSKEILSLDKAPSHLVIIGGGIIALEMGSIWNYLGSKVSIIEKENDILLDFDRNMRKRFISFLRRQGINFYLNSEVLSYDKINKEINKEINEINEKNENNKLLLKIKKGTSKENNKSNNQEKNNNNEEFSLICDKVLISIGRKPNYTELLLENIGIKLDSEKYIEVNHKFQTNYENIYAIGDVIKGPMLAHRAEEDGVKVANIISGIISGITSGITSELAKKTDLKKDSKNSYEKIPKVVYTFPEFAEVGLNENKLKEKNIDFLSGTYPMRTNGRALSQGNIEGFIKVFIDKESQKVLGASILAACASELISFFSLAIDNNLSIDQILLNCSFPHPTFSEGIREAILDCISQSRQI